MIAEMDNDNSGSIEFDEFAKMMSKKTQTTESDLKQVCSDGIASTVLYVSLSRARACALFVFPSLSLSLSRSLSLSLSHTYVLFLSLSRS